MIIITIRIKYFLAMKWINSDRFFMLYYSFIFMILFTLYKILVRLSG